MIYIGHAASNEEGRSTGGKAGDQTGKEVRIDEWYIGSTPWTAMFRPKSQDVANRIAKTMEDACNNNNIGYDQTRRTTLHTKAKAVNFDIPKISSACDTDCSAMVAVCVISAGINVSPSITTHSLQSSGLPSQHFDRYSDPSYLLKPDKLRRGDILVRRSISNGHTVVVLGNTVGAETGAHTAIDDGMRLTAITNKTVFESIYRIPCLSKDIPYIAVPAKLGVVEGKPVDSLIGYCAKLTNLSNSKFTYCLIADIVDSKDWGSVSQKAITNIGLPQTNSGNRISCEYKIDMYLDIKPNWTAFNLQTQINKYGEQMGGDKIHQTSSYDLSKIDYTALTSYILTLDRYSRDLDIRSLTGLKVGGSLIEAGYLFSQSHTQVNFRNPKLEKQVESCTSSKTPFGFYIESKAYTEEEAMKEIVELSYIVRKYPPKLGVWVVPSTYKAKTVNDNILERYEKELVKLGLINNIGLYATREQISRISWDKFKERWALNLVDPISDIEEISKLLTPEFFMLNGGS